jgi:glycosyltransferase involved in cell wall biosynthesis
MKICHLATVASSHRYLLLPQLTALVEAGHDVLAVSAEGPDAAELEKAGIRFRPLAGSTRGFDVKADLRAVASFVEILRDERPDLVHTHNPKPGVYGRIAARLLGVPHVVNTVHGLYATPEDSRLRRSVVYGLEAIASRFSHLELVQNVEDVELMRRTPLAPTPKVRHLGNGIDLSRFAGGPQAGQRSAVRSALRIADDAVVVVSVGRLVAEKGFTELFAASAEIDEPHELVVIGPGDPVKPDALPPPVVNEARRRGVRFLGHRTDIERLLPAMDIFVLASYREGVPRAAMEAAASGLPIVATDIRGCRQVVDDGETGLLVPRGRVQPLAEAIRQLVRDGEMRRRFGKAGRLKAEAEFDERDVVHRLLAAYDETGLGSRATISR